MITTDMLGKVRRMHMRDRLSISEIARRTGLSRNTVRRWLRAPGDLEPHDERSVGVRKLTDYEAILIAALSRLLKNQGKDVDMLDAMRIVV